MSYAATMTQKGQITIPQVFRHRFGLQNRSRVLLELNGKNGILLRPARTILELAGSYKPRRPLNAVRARALMQRRYARV